MHYLCNIKSRKQQINAIKRTYNAQIVAKIRHKTEGKINIKKYRSNQQKPATERLDSVLFILPNIFQYLYIISEYIIHKCNKMQNLQFGHNFNEQKS